MNTLTFLTGALVASSWRMSVLIVLLLVGRRWLRSRVSPGAGVGAWAVIALGLLIPAGIPMAWSPFNFTPRPSWSLLDSETMPALAPVAPGALVSSADAGEASLAIPMIDEPANVPIAAPAAAGLGSISPREWLALGWLGGSLVLIGCQLGGSLFFAGRLRRNRRPAAGRVQQMYAACRQELGLRGRLSVWESPLVKVPAVFGIWRPRVLLPVGIADALGDEDLRHVMLHELGHVGRRDLMIQGIIRLAAALHWWNPLVWLALRAAREDCELACDEQVLTRVPEASRWEYGQTLLRMRPTSGKARRPAAALGIFENRGQLRTRIRRIAEFRVRSRVGACLNCAMVGLVALACLTRELPAQAAGAESPPSNLASPAAPAGMPSVFSVNELLPGVNRALRGGRDFDRGQQLFDAVGCRNCHAFAGSGGTLGPDLTWIGVRFGPQGILEAVIDPSAVISDTYGLRDLTLNDGSRVRGRLVSQDTTNMNLAETYVTDPNTGRPTWTGAPERNIPITAIRSIEWSPVSLMPDGALNGLDADAVADLTAYLMSAGNRGNRMFSALPPLRDLIYSIIEGGIGIHRAIPASGDAIPAGFERRTLEREDRGRFVSEQLFVETEPVLSIDLLSNVDFRRLIPSVRLSVWIQLTPEDGQKQEDFDLVAREIAELSRTAESESESLVLSLGGKVWVIPNIQQNANAPSVEISAVLTEEDSREYIEEFTSSGGSRPSATAPQPL